MPYRTLGELRQELQDRLGFGAAGSAANANLRILNSFLRDAQWQLYHQAHWPALLTVEDFTIGSGSGVVAYASTWNTDRIIKIAANIGTAGTPQWVDLFEGIDTEHYNHYSTTPGYPCRYERRSNGLQILPTRDQNYTGKITYMAPLSAFTQDAHRATIDDGIVFLMALANAKAHYKHKDADQYASQLTAVLTRIKGTQWGNKRFLPRGSEPPDPLPRPVVV